VNVEPVTQSERDTRIMEHYPMVRRIAYRMARRLPRYVDVEDLTHIGILGLIDAVDRYEAGRAPSFTAYARIRIQGAIVDEMRKNDWVPRSVRDRADNLQSAQKYLEKRLGRDPTIQEKASYLGVTEARLHDLIRTADVRVLVSIEDGSDGDGCISDTLTDANTDVVEEMTKKLFGEKVREVVDILPEREKMIVEMYYYRDLTFKEIAHVLGVTESRISQLHSRMKRRIKDHMVTLMAS